MRTQHGDVAVVVVVVVVVDVFVVVLVRNVYILVADSRQCYHRLGAENYSLTFVTNRIPEDWIVDILNSSVNHNNISI